MTAVDAPSASMRIDDIEIVDRHRKELGDLTGLAESIQARALLHPPAVTPDGRLIAGQRRVEACRQLGWEEIPVTVITSLTEMRELLEAERDENTERLEMRPSEKVALGRALEELEKPNADERRREGNARGGRGGEEVAENVTATSRVDVRDVVGGAVGMSGPTYQRAKAVVVAAELGDPVAEDALAQMDSTGKVTPAFEKVMGRSIEGRAKQARHNGTRDGSYKRHATDLVTNVVDRLAAVPMALREIDVSAAILDPDAPLVEWDRKLTDAIQTFNRLRGQIRKEMSK